MPKKNGVGMPKAPGPHPEKGREAMDRDRLRVLAKELWPEARASWREEIRRYEEWQKTGVCDCPACLPHCPQCHQGFVRKRPEQRWCSKRCASVPKGQRRKGQKYGPRTRKEQPACVSGSST